MQYLVFRALKHLKYQNSFLPSWMSVSSEYLHVVCLYHFCFEFYPFITCICLEKPNKQNSWHCVQAVENPSSLTIIIQVFIRHWTHRSFLTMSQFFFCLPNEVFNVKTELQMLWFRSKVNPKCLVCFEVWLSKSNWIMTCYIHQWIHWSMSSWLKVLFAGIWKEVWVTEIVTWEDAFFFPGNPPLYPFWLPRVEQLSLPYFSFMPFLTFHHA